MKILSASLCLAAAVCVAAQAAPEQESQSYFALAMQRDEPQDTVSEFEYRSKILAQFNIGGFQEQDVAIPGVAVPTIPGIAVPTIPGVDVPTIPVPTIPVPTIPVPTIPVTVPDIPQIDPCKSIPELARNLVPKMDGLIDGVLKQNHITDAIIAVIKAAVKPVKAILESIGLEGVSNAALTALNTALTGIILALQPSVVIPVIGPIIQQGLDIVSAIRSAFNTVKNCDKSKMSIEPATCSVLADVYRASVKFAAEKFPGANDANNEELKNLISGAVAVLGVMDQFSIVSSNDALIASRPIFSASLLDQYRQEIVEKADSDALKQYAQADLAILVSISNALEACLHVAADPVAAAEELAAEYEAMGADDEYDDEDEE
ncbi:hypothetical protein BGZ95_010599 [Linnemannia exigua]|uniref:Uncharacterized protein n=1 Tax=Linnemannia exigua TaxID=604196 RepID=A0AAD4DCV4_9FUNG|nr:hypothetical protein BGZ95_010599 [Linnemannia exigua]